MPPAFCADPQVNFCLLPMGPRSQVNVITTGGGARFQWPIMAIARKRLGAQAIRAHRLQGGASTLVRRTLRHTWVPLWTIRASPGLAACPPTAPRHTAGARRGVHVNCRRESHCGIALAQKT